MAGAVLAGRPTRTAGTPAPLQGAGQRVVAVQGGEQHAVDVAADHIALQPPPSTGKVLGDQQQELDAGLGQDGADPATMPAKNGSEKKRAWGSRRPARPSRPGG